ncbi:MAG TPA: hypothetical protein VGL94_11800 [Ktedonobacteraceae bacterium]|jgi:hypothetical protein
MNRSLLSRLHTNGVSYLISGVLLLIGIPLYQVVVLNPAGLDDVLNGTGTGGFTAYLTWISQHSFQFIIYRVLLILAFALLFTLPFSLYRIIVAQEIMGQRDRSEEEEQIEDTNGTKTVQESDQQTEQGETNGMPPYAWRGRGFVVLAAWAGIISLVIYVLGAIASTLYFMFILGRVDRGTVASFVSIFAISTNTIGIGLLGLSTLFFGAMICRTGLNLWPAHWVVFSYTAILVGGLLCISAVGVAGTPGVGQNTITTIATLLFALWVFCLGLMLIRLRPEA